MLQTEGLTPYKILKKNFFKETPIKNKIWILECLELLIRRIRP